MSDVPQNPPQPDRPPQPAVPSEPPAAPQQPAAGQAPPYAQAPAYPQAPAYDQQQGYPQAPAYGEPAPSTSYPGKTMGIVAFILSLAGLVTSGLASVVGLILGIVALVQSKKAGHKNGLALAAIIIGAIIVVLCVVGLVIFFLWFGAFMAAMNQCLIDPNAVVSVWGMTLPCSSVN